MSTKSLKNSKICVIIGTYVYCISELAYAHANNRITEKGDVMDSKAKKLFDDDNKEEVFTRTQVMLQRTKRPILPHEWLKLLGITNEIQRAKIEAKKKNGPRFIQVPKLSKPLINRLIRTGYQIDTVSPDSNPTLKWFEIRW